MFKRKLSWGGKQGTQSINSNKNRDSIMFLDSEYNPSDDLSREGNISSGSLQTLKNQGRDVESGTERELEDDQFTGYIDDTDFEDAFSSPRNSQKFKDEKTITTNITSDVSSNSEHVKPRRKRKKEKKIKILDIVNEEDSEEQEEDEVKNEPEPDSKVEKEEEKEKEKIKDSEQQQQQQQSTPRDKTEVAVESPKASEESKFTKLKKRPSLFSRQSIFKIFRGKKEKDDKISSKVNSDNVSVKAEESLDMTKKTKRDTKESIEDSVEEITSHHQLKHTIKECKLSSKFFLKQMKTLNEVYIIPGLKKNIDEFNEISKFINRFIHSYGSHWKLGRKYRDDQWKFGSFFVNLHQFCEEEFKKYKKIMCDLLDYMKSDNDEYVIFNRFIGNPSDKERLSKKETAQFEDLILSPINHLQTLAHTTYRLSLLTPVTHSEYNNVIVASREFEKLNKEVFNIYEKEPIDEVKLIEKMVYFTPSVVKFNIANGHRKLIKQGQFNIFELDESNSKILNIYAFLFNDVLLICKSNSDSQTVNEDNLENKTEESEKKYALIAVIRIDRIFIVDPSDGLHSLQRKSSNDKIDMMLEIVEVGSAIHKLIFENANEKNIWKRHFERAIADIIPSFSLINHGAVYRNLLLSSSSASVDEDVWPHNISLLTLKNKADIYDDLTLVSKQNSEVEKLKEEIKSLKENKDLQIQQIIKENESVKQLTELCESLRSQLDDEKKKRNELESKYENLMNIVNKLTDQVKSNKEEYQMYNKNLELELIRQREQHSQDMQKIMALIDNTPVRQVSQNVLPNKKSFRKTKSKSNIDEDKQVNSEKSQELSESKETPVTSPKLRSHISSPNLSNKLSDSGKDSAKSKPRKLKSVKYNYSSEDPIPLKQRIKKFGFGKKREESQRHWRKSPVTSADSPVLINKPKKVDWIGVKGENYYSDDVTSDIDGFVYENQSMSYHSDYFNKNERSNPEREYLSDCSDFEYQEYQMIKKKDVF